jgi:hypothetical protein
LILSFSVIRHQKRPAAASNHEHTDNYNEFGDGCLRGALIKKPPGSPGGLYVSIILPRPPQTGPAASILCLRNRFRQCPCHLANLVAHVAQMVHVS